MQISARYLVGIDLGTTNSVVAYIDTQQATSGGQSEIHTFHVPQLVAPGETRSERTLPSFLYFPTETELETGLFGLPWDATQTPTANGEAAIAVAGVIAREHGSLVPARQVMSAKSWLSNSGIDRTAKILPREAKPALISPVEASARYLQHLRKAWNTALPDESSRLENQEIFLTVPASFDEEARELTVQAARQAGLENVILLEEPLAAFYAWTAAKRDQLKDDLRDGDVVLICDIGGGTSDFSLVRARISGDDVQFERKAIGEHLLLGGDNLDLALARLVEAKLVAPSPSGKGAAPEHVRLTVRQRHALQRACCAAKERLLTDPELERAPVTILGGGRQVVGQMLTTELHRDEVVRLLTEGFLPLTAADELPNRTRSAGLREMGLPYANDPAITRHLAAFLKQAGEAMAESKPETAHVSHANMGCLSLGIARPDAILFNGGFCVPLVARERIVDAVAGWFPEMGEGWRPRELRNEFMDSAVAIGAAHYGRVRRGVGVRVRAGIARSYYVGLRSERGLQGVCVLPSGVEEGTSLTLEGRDFAVHANRPVSFDLYSSRMRHDRHGEVADLSGEQVHRHAPLVTLLRYGKMRDVALNVRLRAVFTEVGTLELWCESVNSPHRWRLQFELRGEEAQAQAGAEKGQASPIPSLPASSIPEETLDSALGLVRSVFGKAGGDEAPETLANRLESTVGLKRDSWPIDVTRHLADTLIEVAEGRKKSPQHEVRWLNLTGFCLRPGFGVEGDQGRVNQLRKSSQSGPAFPRELQSEVQWLVTLRRVCGGLNAAQQHELYRKYSGPLKPSGKKKSARINPQVEYDSWRLLASLEYLSANIRVSLGNELIAKFGGDSDKRWLWPIARLGARIPLYGPLAGVVPAEAAGGWIQKLLNQAEFSTEVVFAIVQLGRRTDDISRDIDDSLRRRAIRELKAAGVDEDSIERLERFVPPERSDAVRAFGESLPKGLHLVSSANCLLSVSGLMQDPDRVA
jgi:DNA-K related protein/Hsp70 protein